MKILLNLTGILLVLAIMYLIFWKKKNISVKMLVKAVIAQFLIAVILVKVPAGRYVVSRVSDAVTSVINCGQDGLSFVFGSLADSSAATGSVFAIQVLGNIVFLSALVSLLYYIGILGFVVKWIGKAVGKLMGTSEVESFVAVANMFLGQTDSPILVSKYLGQMTDSEVMVVLVSGMGSMSVSILGGYTALGIPMEYLLIASTLVPVGSIMVAKMLLPQTEEVREVGSVKMDNKGNNTCLLYTSMGVCADCVHMGYDEERQILYSHTGHWHGCAGACPAGESGDSFFFPSSVCLPAGEILWQGGDGAGTVHQGQLSVFPGRRVSSGRRSDRKRRAPDGVDSGGIRSGICIGYPA